MSLEPLRLNKTLTAAMLDAGYYAPKEIQSKTVSRILGGQNMLAIAPEGSGKTTAYVVATLMRLKEPKNGAARALVIVPSKEQLLSLTNLFLWLGKSTGLRVACLTTGLSGEQYMEAIEDGQADIIIGMPDKIGTLYGKALLNLRSLMMIIVDDADTIAKTNQLATLYHLFEGLTKCQKLFMANTMNDKLERLIGQIVPNAELIESLLPEEQPILLPMVVYNTPNYKAKLNLLEQLLRDPKMIRGVIFMNTKEAAEALFNTLKKRLGRIIGILKTDGMDSLDLFKQSPEIKALILCNEDQPSFNLLGIPYIFHAELPSEKEIFLRRITKITSVENTDAVSITLATQQEMETVKKIEQAIGQKMKISSEP